MTWLQVLRGRKFLSSIFLLLSGEGTQNDRMLRFLEWLEQDKASINDLYARHGLPREAIIAVLEARIQRRLA